MKPILAFVFSLLVTGASALPPRSDVDALHYRFSITLSDAHDSIDVVAEVTILFKEATGRVALDLVAPRPDGTGMRVRGVEVEGKALAFTHRGDRLDIQLPSEVRAGEKYCFLVTYVGIPDNGLLIGKNGFGDRTFFANNWPDRARCWIACVDHPSDKASCEFIVTAPDHYQVVGNGVCVERTSLSGASALTHWSEPHLLPTKVMASGVARFASFFSTCSECDPNVPLSAWLYPQTRSQTLPKFDPLPRVIDYFARSVGPYPYAKMASVQSSNRYGGLENANAVFYKDTLVGESPDIEKLIAHELAHQWFGDAVTELDWPHLWLSEGFATYFSALYIEHAHGPEKFNEEMTAQRRVVARYGKTSSRPVIDSVETDPNILLNPNSYQKGSWVLHMLRRKMGDAAFWSGIKAYYAAYAHGNATTADFQSAMEKAFGASLTPFFRQWLTQAGHPVLAVSWVYHPKQAMVHVTLTQRQSAMFTFPIDIGVVQPDGSLRSHAVLMDSRSNVFKLPSPQEPARLSLDPSVNLLFEPVP